MKGAEVPIADAEDGRWEELASNVPEAPYEDFEDSDESEDDEGQPIPRRRTGKGRADDEKIREHIDAKSREELAALVWSLTQRFPGSCARSFASALLWAKATRTD